MFIVTEYAALSYNVNKVQFKLSFRLLAFDIESKFNVLLWTINKHYNVV